MQGETGKPDRAGAPKLLKLLFPGLSGPVFLANDQALLQGLVACLTGWFPEISITGRDAGEAPDRLALIEADPKGGYCYRSRFAEEAVRQLPLASAICALVADLSQDWCETRPGTFGLHCGALRIAGRLVLIAGPGRAGKSTLVTRLATEPGVTLWCDDVLPLAAGEGLSSGIAPRLRLPVPPSSPQLGDLAARALILADDRYGYVALRDQAAWGSAAAIGAIILLDRRAGAPARLHRLEPERAVELLLRQLITGFATAEEALTTVEGIAAGCLCLRLVCSDVDEAAGLLLRSFAQGGPGPNDIAPPIPDLAQTTRRKAVHAHRVYARQPGVVIRRHGDGAFLWHAGEAFLWRLNQVALAVWQMLELPGTAQDLTEALHEIYPAVPEAELFRDIRRLLADLADAELIANSG